jgi:hypothetical protein
MKNIKLKNVAIYPSEYSVEINAGGGSQLYWGNVNFQEFGSSGERIWNFQGSGFGSNIEITYTITSPYNISFTGRTSGIINTLDSSNLVAWYSESSNRQIVLRFQFTLETAQNFGYNFFVKDSNSNYAYAYSCCIPGCRGDCGCNNCY